MENMRKPKNGKHAENILDKSPKAKKNTFQNLTGPSMTGGGATH